MDTCEADYDRAVMTLHRNNVVIAVLILAGTLFAQQTPTVSGTAAVSGIVVDDATGKALAGATVSLQGTGSVRVGLRTVTDSKGRFVFYRLPAGDSYYLRSVKAGYVAGGISLRNANFSVSPFSLSEGEWIGDVSLPMSRPGGISGRVVDERGEPVVDIPIRVLMQIPMGGFAHWGAGPVARTDDRGMYRISGLFPGTYVVGVPSVQSVVPSGTGQARLLGYSSSIGGPLPRASSLDRHGVWQVPNGYITPPADANLVYPIAFYPQAPTVSEATPLLLAASEERRNVDFDLRPVKAVRVSGRVVSPSGTPEGLLVRLLQKDAQSLGIGSEQATALVSSDGRFTIVGVPAGQYVLAAQTAHNSLRTSPLPRTPGLVMTEHSQFLSWMPSLTSLSTITTVGAQTYSATLPLDVGNDDLSDVALTLEPGVAVRGRVLLEGGQPFTHNVTVAAMPAGRNLLASAIDRTAPRNPPGAFRLDGLLPGEYIITVSGTAGFGMKAVTAGGIDYADRSILLEPGGTDKDLAIVMTDRFGSLSGAVANPVGQSVTQGAVILFPADKTRWTNFGPTPRLIRSVFFLGARGYEIPRIPGGDYFVVAVDASLRDAWLDPRFFPAAAPVASRIRVDWGKPSVHDLTMQRVNLK